MQSQYINYPLNQQGNNYPSNQQPCQPNLMYSHNQPIPNSYQTPYPIPCNSSSTSAPQCGGTLSPALLEQIRNACTTPAGPIFILPTNPTPPSVQPCQQTMGLLPNCPGMRIPCGTSSPLCCSPPSCIPYPVPMPIFNPFGVPTTSIKEITNCNCNSRRCTEPYKTSNCVTDCCTEHYCVATPNDTICAKKSCPLSINLQALASQLLAIQGVISCAATRLVLRKISGSNVTNTMEEIVERARRTIHTLTQDQLLAESRNAHQINALINLHMTANPPSNVIPILTTIQLKINLLKSHVENLISCNVMENQSVGAEGNKCLNSMTLSMRCNEDLRTMLATLRQKECDERVNLNFAPYHSQRTIAECRLRNIESKIQQVEAEIRRRRCAAIPRIPIRYEDPGAGYRGPWCMYSGTLPHLRSFKQETICQPQCCESPDPFQIEVRNTRRLNLKPHVGSPETTYNPPPEQMHNNKREAVFTQQTRNDTHNGDNDQNARRINSQDENMDSENCDCCCDCSKSSDDDSTNEEKKKLQVTSKKTIQAKRDNINVTKRKTVDFVRENIFTDNTKNLVMSMEMPMEMPEKDSDTAHINDTTDSNIVKIDKTESNQNHEKRKITSLLDTKEFKLNKNPSMLILHDSEDELHPASFAIHFENTQKS